LVSHHLADDEVVPVLAEVGEVARWRAAVEEPGDVEVGLGFPEGGGVGALGWVLPPQPQVGAERRAVFVLEAEPFGHAGFVA
jgi:hypothetical protein